MTAPPEPASPSAREIVRRILQTAQWVGARDDLEAALSQGEHLIRAQWEAGRDAAAAYAEQQFASGDCVFPNDGAELAAAIRKLEPPTNGT